MGFFDKLKKTDRGDPLTDPALNSTSDPFSTPSNPSNPYGEPTPDNSRDPFSIGQDPMGGGFAPDSSAQQPTQQSQSYPTSAPFPGQNRGAPEEQHFQEHFEETSSHRDAELILAKLDAIKAELDSLHQRVRTIEQRGRTTPPVEQPKKYAW